MNRPLACVLPAALAALLGACIVRIEPLAGASGDSCRSQSVAFVQVAAALQPSGAVQPGRWQDSGPALQPELATRLAGENAELERLQISFDSLLYCRWIELRTIRADASSGRLPRPAARERLAAARARLDGELDRARAAAARVQERGRALDAQVDRAAPGTVAALGRTRAGRDAPLRAVAAATVPLRLRPDPAAPEVGRVAAGRSVTMRPAQGGFALIAEPGGVQGYAPTGAFNLTAAEPAAPAAGGDGGGLRTLLATNVARRDNFVESVELSARSLAAGFEEAI